MAMCSYWFLFFSSRHDHVIWFLLLNVSVVCTATTQEQPVTWSQSHIINSQCFIPSGRHWWCTNIAFALSPVVSPVAIGAGCRHDHVPPLVSVDECFSYTLSPQWSHLLILIMYSLVPITVYPSHATVHIGLSSSPYSFLTASNVEQMDNCTSLPGPLAQGIDFERQCQPGATGHYVYVFIEGRSGDSQLDIWELQMYDDPGLYVYRVNTTCETHGCRTTQLPHMRCMLEWSPSGHCMLTSITPQGPSKWRLKKTVNARRFQIHWNLSHKFY